MTKRISRTNITYDTRHISTATEVHSGPTRHTCRYIPTALLDISSADEGIIDWNAF